MRLLSVVFALLSLSFIPTPVSAMMSAFKRGLRRVFGRPTAPPEPVVVQRPIAIAWVESPRDPDLDCPFNVGQFRSGGSETILTDYENERVLTVESDSCTITISPSSHRSMYTDPNWYGIKPLLEQGSCLSGEITSDNREFHEDLRDMWLELAGSGKLRIQCYKWESFPTYTFQTGSVGDPSPSGWSTRGPVPKDTPDRAKAYQICASLIKLQGRVQRLLSAIPKR